VETVAPLFTALMALSMGVSTLIRGARDRLHQQYAFLAGVLSIVYLCLFFLLLSKDPAWRYGVLSSALLVVPASLQVYRQVLHRYELGFMRFVPALYAVALLQFVVIIVLGPENRIVIFSNATIVFGGLTIHVLGLWRLIRSLPRPEERRRIGYLLWLGGIAVFAVGLEMGFLDLNFWSTVELERPIDFPPVGSLATAAYIYFLGQVIQSAHLLDRHHIISRVVVLAVMATVVAVVYTVLVSIVGDDPTPGAMVFNSFIASMLVLILYEPIKMATERYIFPLMARERFESVSSLQALKRRLPGMIQIDPLLDDLLGSPIAAGRVDLASVYLFDENRGGYRLRRWEGTPEHALLPALPQRPFIDGFLEGRRWYSLADLQAWSGRRSAGAPPPDWLEGVIATMQALQADLCMPIQIGPTVVGLWNIRPRAGAEDFSVEELELFRDIAETAAVVVDNSRAFEQMKSRDRLATLGEMSAGLAHEIRNPLGAIKGAVQVLAKSRKDAAADEWLEIIVEEVDRLNGVVSQFLDYARPLQMHVASVDPGLVLKGVLALIDAEGLPANVRVAYLPAEDLIPVSLDVEKLKQVLLNLIHNGIEAMAKKGGTLTIRTRILDRRGGAIVPSLHTIAPGRTGEVKVRRGRLNSDLAVELSFEDQGSGIKPDDARKLFIPFFTTKTSGTGLGLAISERIVRGHSGELVIESAARSGTRITLRLPADETPTPSLDEETTLGEPDAKPIISAPIPTQ
jgi:two-component system, NtrC family, sensor histidine kinase HydH